jgi:hypothetical protein
VISESEEEQEIEEKKSKVDQEGDIEMKEAPPKQEGDSQLDHSDDETFDKEIEEAAAEEKEAKQEKIEMMSIIHTL